MICSKCGKNESKYETRLGFLCLECYNNSLKKVDEPSLNVLFAEEPYFQEIFTLQEKIMKLFAYIVLMTDQIRQQIQMRTKLIGLYT